MYSISRPQCLNYPVIPETQLGIPDPPFSAASEQRRKSTSWETLPHNGTVILENEIKTIEEED
jgi:hypothetical protein